MSEIQKYDGEASSVARLLQEHNYAAAGQALHADGHLQPHELPKFMDKLKAAYAKTGLHDVEITNDKSGIKVQTHEAGKEPQTLFERSGEEQARVKDKIPMTGELLHLNKDQTDSVLKQQQEEKQKNAGKCHKFGDIAVSKGYASPEQVNKALEKQDRKKAEQAADDQSRSMPIQEDEGYSQMVHRSHPELSDAQAKQEVKHMKSLNHGQNVLHVGDQVPTMSAEQKRHLAADLYKENRKRTGVVKAKPGQSLSEIPID